MQKLPWGAIAATASGIGIDVVGNSLAQVWPKAPHLLWVLIFVVGTGLTAVLPIWAIGAAIKQWREKKAGNGMVRAVEGFNKIIDYSRWAHDGAKNWQSLQPVMYEKDQPERTVIEARLRQALAGQIHDHLAQGRLTALGRTGDANVQVQIPTDDWKRIKIDFGDRVLAAKSMDGGPPNTSAWSQEPNALARKLIYGDVRFMADELFSIYPLSQERR